MIMNSKITKLFTVFLFLYSYTIKSQTANQLIRINNVADNNAMNAIASPNEGSLVYVSSSDNVYYFGNGTWNLIGGSGSTTDTNDDAWGVTGEDLVSDINRTGKVTIGQSGNTTVKLDVNGQAIVRNLPNDLSGGKGVIKSDNGELHSDTYTSHVHGGIVSYSWKTLCYAKKGVVVTGHYRSDNNYSNGHFQFRFHIWVTPPSVSLAVYQPYILVYNHGNASFTYDLNSTILTVTAPTYCGSYSTQFRLFNNNLQMKQGSSASPLEMDIRVEGY